MNDIGGALTNRICTTISDVGAAGPKLSELPRPSADRKRERDARASKSGKVRTTRIESWEGVSDLQAAWNDLVNRSPVSSVFQAFSWHLCWWRAFGGPYEPFVILAYADSQLIGIAPMMVTRRRGAMGRVQRELHFIGSINHASDYCDFITDPDVPEALDALLEELCASSEEFHRIDLSHFPSHSPNQAQTLEYFKSRGMRTSFEVQAEALTRILGDGQADLKAANKSSLKRHTGFFQKSGDLRFHQCASEAEILGYLEQFFEQHRARWMRTDSPSQFLDPAQQAFYRELVREIFPKGWLRFDVVLFNETPLAFHFGFEYRRRFIWYKPTFDVQFASRSPGEVLIKFLLEDAIKKKLEEFDFTIGAESFKYRFANRTRYINRLIVFRSAGDHWIYQGKCMLKKLKRNYLKRRPGASSADRPAAAA
jgi:CelD/BcsL family acetyltransferase involved in cellulose biosynthesis